MNTILKSYGWVYAAMFCLSLFMFGCDTTTTTSVNVNSGNNENGINENANSNSTGNDNAESTSDTTTSTIEATEPDKYEAKVNLNFEAVGGDNKASLPGLAAKVARDGADKRMEFSMPNGQRVVYLETGGKNLVILPERKQYAELNKDGLGFEVRSLMTPGQIIDRAKQIKGLEKAGEEKYKGRDAIKYVYKATTDTKTKAGEVETESYFYVDKETGLPLKTEVISESRAGTVQGFKGLKIVTEISDIKTQVSEDIFKEPEGFEKINEEQIRNQINLIFSAAASIIKQIVQSGAAN